MFVTTVNYLYSFIYFSSFSVILNNIYYCLLWQMKQQVLIFVNMHKKLEVPSFLESNNGKIYFEKTKLISDSPGFVSKGVYERNAQFFSVMVKFIHLPEENNLQKIRQQGERQKKYNQQIMRDENNKYIMKPIDIGYFNQNQGNRYKNTYFFIVLPRYEYNLDALKQKGDVWKDQQVIIDIISQILQSILYAHKQKKISMRDIKPENFVAKRIEETNFWSVFMIDLGMAKEIMQDQQKKLQGHTAWAGTISFMPPEQLKSIIKGPHLSRNLFKIDSFSLGLTIYNLLTNQDFYDNQSLIKSIKDKNSDKMNEIVKQAFQKFYNNVRNLFQDHGYKYISKNEQKNRQANRIIHEILLSTVIRQQSLRKTVEELKINTNFCKQLFQFPKSDISDCHLSEKQKLHYQKIFQRKQEMEQVSEKQQNQNQSQEWIIADQDLTYQQYIQLLASFYTK